MKKPILLLAILVMLMIPYSVWAANMTSANFRIQLDSFTSGNNSTSTNYDLIDATGEIADETSTSTNYQLVDGLIGSFQDGILTATIDRPALDFLELSTDTVSEKNNGVRVTTDAIAGYTVKMSEDGQLRSGDNDIDDVGDFTVSAGSEEYGFRTSGTSGSWNTRDIPITTALLTIASSSVPTTAELTTITFKAAISEGTEVGTYAHTITISTVVNF